MTCQQIESLLPPFVDGTAPADEARRVSVHLAECDGCRHMAEAQHAARTVLRARAAALAPQLPPGLHTRVTALTREPAPGAAESMRWHGRLSAFAAALLVVLTAGAVLLPIVTARSTVLLAAQLALDHLKCFVIDGDHDNAPITSAQAEDTIRTEYGRDLDVPAAVESEGMTLVAVRQCLYGDGLAAHLLYRMAGEPVSLFIVPGLVRPAAELSTLGHAQIVWSAGGKTYVLVAAERARERLHRVASRFKVEAQ